MKRLTRRGIPILPINILVISNNREMCERLSSAPPVASRIYGCIPDAAVISEMIALYRPKAIYVLFSKGERAVSIFGAVNEYSSLCNVRVGIVGSDAQFSAVRKVYDGEVCRMEISHIRRDIAKVRNEHSLHAHELAKRMKSIADGTAPYVAVFGFGLNSCVSCERIFDNYFMSDGIRLKTVYIDLKSTSISSIRERVLRPDLMVLPCDGGETMNKKVSAVLKSAAFSDIPYMTYSTENFSDIRLLESGQDKHRLSLAGDLFKAARKK